MRKGKRAMYHYDPEIALQEVKEEAVLPHPVHVRDMMLRAHLSPDRALELNRKFQSYLNAFGDAQTIVRDLLSELATTPEQAVGNAPRTQRHSNSDIID